MIGNLGDLSPAHLQNMALQNGNSLAKRAENLKDSGDETKLRQFSKDFEALFIQHLLKEMRKSMPKGGLIEKSLSMEWFESMFDESVSKEISQGTGIGMAKVIYEQLTQTANVDRPYANLADYKARIEGAGKSKDPDRNGVSGDMSGAKAEDGNRDE